MQIETYHLPSHWACAFLYGDHSGLDESDIAALEAWEAGELADTGTLVCVSVDIDDSGDFRRWHDASHVLPLACDVAAFHFDKGV